MTLDVGTALQLAGDVAADSAHPAQSVYDALTLFRAYQTMSAASGLSAMVLALDKAGQFDAAVDALAELAPVLKAVKDNKDHRAKLMTVLASVA